MAYRRKRVAVVTTLQTSSRAVQDRSQVLRRQSTRLPTSCIVSDRLATYTVRTMWTRLRNAAAVNISIEERLQRILLRN